MRVVVAGDFKTPVLFETDKATGLLVETRDGRPAVIYQALPKDAGYIRFTRGEDENFDQIAKSLGFNVLDKS
jgi:hypothetical protein